jgi:hypothetical protein
MKKLIIASIALSVVATSGYSQGVVAFSGGGNAATRTSTNSVVGGAATGSTAATAGLYYYALFASANQTSINGSTAPVSGLSANYVFNNLGTGVPTGGWELVGIGANIASAGRFSATSQGTTSAGQGAVNADGSLTVQLMTASSTANLVIVGWSANAGTTLTALEAWYAAGANGGWIGQSGIGSGVLGDGASLPTPTLLGTGPGQVGGLLLGLTPSVPEPGTLALAALGGASLLLFRRKK